MLGMEKFFFPAPPSTFVTAMSFISFVSAANIGVSEFRGKHMKYSKFFIKNDTQKVKFEIPSRVGMFFIYAPAFVIAAASFFVFPDEGLRFILLRFALTLQFLKRVLEVLFVHKYGSNGIALEDAVMIALSYPVTTITMIYAQHLSSGFPEPSIDLKYVGVVLFLVGIAGNFYHHYILSTLREKGDKEYKIPKGGLFNQVICPHYLFEVLGFVGVSCIAQTVYSASFTAGSAFYLLGRSYSTRKWYLSKFEDFPKDVKAIIPFVF